MQVKSSYRRSSFDALRCPQGIIQLHQSRENCTRRLSDDPCGFVTMDNLSRLILVGCKSEIPRFARGLVGPEIQRLFAQHIAGMFRSMSCHPCLIFILYVCVSLCCV